MKFKHRWGELAALATAAITSISLCRPVQAVTFEEQEIDPSNFIAVAASRGEDLYNLLVIEQIPGQRQCWSESGSKPVIVEPLMMNFDFTESCRRSTDSNGYSIRIDGQDYGMDYLLRIVEHNGELQLVGTPVGQSEHSEVVIGRTYGLDGTFMKIFLNPGWQLTKRTYEGKALGHVYFSGSRAAMAAPDSSVADALETEGDDPASQAALSFSAPRSPSGASSPLFENSSSETAQTQSERVTITAPAPADSPLPPLPDSFSNSPAPSTNALSSNSPLPPPPAPRPVPPSLQEPPADSVPIAVPSPDIAESSSAAPPSSTPNRSLSDILAVDPRVPNGQANTVTADKLPVPQPPTNSNAGALDRALSSSTAGQRQYKVMVEASNKDKVRSLYPEAFSTVYDGQSVLQIGVFSSRDNADKAMQSLRGIGLTGILVPL